MQVGGYGVGFKAGSMVLAHTAVIISWKHIKGKRVLSIAVLSNQPFEKREEEPIRLIASIDCDSMMPACGSTKQEYKEVRRTIEDINVFVDPVLGEWIKDKSPHGTSVILIGVREGLFDFDSGEAFRTADAILLSQTTRDGKHPGNSSRALGDIVEMDYSLRAFLEIMFFGGTNSNGDPLKISLFGKDVKLKPPLKQLKRESLRAETIEWKHKG